MRLAEKEKVVLDAVLAGAPFNQACEIAKVRPSLANKTAILLSPSAISYAHKRTRGLLQIEGAPAAYNFMMEILRDPTKDARLRVDVAKTIFAAGGFTPPKAAEIPQDAEDVLTGNADPKDLKAFADGLAREIQMRKEKRVIIDVTPQPATQPIESLF